jgi:hypothetical protein
VIAIVEEQAVHGPDEIASDENVPGVGAVVGAEVVVGAQIKRKASNSLACIPTATIEEIPVLIRTATIVIIVAAAVMVITLAILVTMATKMGIIMMIIDTLVNALVVGAEVAQMTTMILSPTIMALDTSTVVDCKTTRDKCCPQLS